MNGSILYLHADPLRESESLIASPIRVHFAVRSRSDDDLTRFDVRNPSWKMRESAGDYRTTNELFNKLQDARIGGKTLLEFTRHKGVSMWQFLPSYIWPAFFRTVQLIDVVGELIEEVAPREVHMFQVECRAGQLWRGAVQAVCELHGIPFFVIQQGRLHLLQNLGCRTRRFLHFTYAGLAIGYLRRFLRWYRTPRQRHVVSDDRVGRKILFATIARHWAPVPWSPDRRYDEQFHPLLDALRSAGWAHFVGIDCPYSSDHSRLEERMDYMEPGVRWRAFYGNRFPALGGSEVFRELWNKLEKNAEFDGGFRYRGVRLMPALRLELRRAFQDLLPECAEMLTISTRILQEECPDAVVATYETGPFQRALVIKASCAGIQTMGLQHGMIAEDHYDYMHCRVSTDPTAAGFVVPNVTCVWGPLWRKILTEKGHYPPEAVAVTGNWRYDKMQQIASAVEADKIRQTLGIARERKVVLVLSSGQHVADYIDLCLQTLTEREDLSVLVKLHPADDPQPVRKILTQSGYAESVLVEMPLVSAMMLADLVISQVSTAVSEAVLLDKTVILVNTENLAGANAYVEHGICLYVRHGDELRNAIQRAFDPSVRSAMASARTKFVRESFYKTDGSAAPRVARVLKARMNSHGATGARGSWHASPMHNEEPHDAARGY